MFEIRRARFRFISFWVVMMTRQLFEHLLIRNERSSSVAALMRSSWPFPGMDFLDSNRESLLFALISPHGVSTDPWAH